MNLLKESWHRLRYGLLILAVAVAAVAVVAPKPALADESDEPYALTPDAHWFYGGPHDPEPWPNEDGSPLEYPIYVPKRMDVEFNIEARDNDAPKGYVLWQLFDESGKEVFSAYLLGLNRYCVNGGGFVLNEGTYVQRLTQFGCEGTVCNICLEAHTDPDTWVWPGPSKAESIIVGSTVTDKLTDSYESGYGENETAVRFYKDFRFTLADPTDVKFKVEPQLGQTQLSLMDADGTLLSGASSTFDSEHQTYAGFDLDCGRLGAGEYYLRYEVVSTPGNRFDGSDSEFTLSAKAGREVFRLYDPNSGDHLLTTSDAERSALIANGWNDEGVAARTPLKSDHPVWRLFDPVNGDHMYTASKNEYETLGTRGWHKEGIAFYSVDDPTAAEYEGVAVGRLFDPDHVGAGSHHFVALDASGNAEYSQLLKLDWAPEGHSWTVLSWE